MRPYVHRKIALVSLCSGVVFLPYSILACHLSILTFIINWIAEGRWQQKASAIKSNPHAFLLPGYFLVHVVGMMWTANTNVGWMKLETKILFLLFPFVAISSVPFTRRELNTVLLSFVTACSIATLICLSHSVWMVVHEVPFANFGNGGLDLYETLNSGASAAWMHFSYLGLASGIGLHPTYFGLYLLSCQLIAVYLYTQPDHSPGPNKIRYLMMAAFIYFLVFVVLLGSRIIIVCELLVAIGTIVFLTRRYGYTAVAVGACVIVLMALLIYGNPVVRYRGYQELIATSVRSAPPALADNSVSIRASLWWLSAKAMVEMNLLTGYGTGDTQDAMKALADRYNAHNVLGSYDPHNQFVYTFLSTGLLGLGLLVSCFVTFLVMAWKRKSIFCFAFLVVFIITCLTESVLELQKGVVLFTFFTAGFIWLEGNKLSIE